MDTVNWIELANLTFNVLNLSAIIVATILVVCELRMNKHAKFTELWLEAERDFVELEKVMLDDKDLRDIYRLGDADFAKDDDVHLKKFVFFEMYYAHLAKVYRMFRSRLNPHAGKTLAKEYWALYRPVVGYLAKDPIFLEVHEDAKEMRTFEPEFFAEVEEILAAR
jgi:hypothetical protein